MTSLYTSTFTADCGPCCIRLLEIRSIEGKRSQAILTKSVSIPMNILLYFSKQILQCEVKIAKCPLSTGRSKNVNIWWLCIRWFSYTVAGEYKYRIQCSVFLQTVIASNVFPFYNDLLILALWSISSATIRVELHFFLDAV